MKPNLLIVDDDEDLRTQMKWALASDYGVFLADCREGALDLLKRISPPVMTLDLGLPPDPAGVSEGFNALSDSLAARPGTKVIIITGRAEKEHALRAVSEGAYDYLSKPIDIEELKVILRRAFQMAQLEKEHEALQRRQGVKAFAGMMGTCAAMQEVFSLIRKVSATEAPVLICGESGTGKELVARAIHSKSLRSEKSFITINCGAIPENLLESELFGHEKGAFTGAHTQREGRVELAEGGTLFLDEIGELPLSLQVKLLRFLQEKVIERVGGRKEIPVDARIIAATNRDLKKAMEEAAFREDLFFRLSVVNITLPPLREREGDITLLAKAFLDRFASESGKRVIGFTTEAVRAIEEWPWTGNVRELENRVKRAVIMAAGRRVTPADLDISAPQQKEDTGPLRLKEARDAVEKDLIVKALRRNKGNMSSAAAELGISRPTLYGLLEKHGIPQTDFAL